MWKIASNMLAFTYALNTWQHDYMNINFEISNQYKFFYTPCSFVLQIKRWKHAFYITKHIISKLNEMNLDDSTFQFF